MNSSTPTQDNTNHLSIEFSSLSKAVKDSVDSELSLNDMIAPIDHTITKNKNATSTTCACHREQSSPSIDVNRTFASVYIDKDDDYLTRHNASFTYSENRCDCGRINRSTSLKNIRVISRRKFYKWAWASTGDVDNISIKKRYQRSTSQQIGRRLGLVRR